MKKETLPNKLIVDELKNYKYGKMVILNVETENGKYWANKYGVELVPTIVIVKEDGQIVNRIVGFVTVNVLL